MGRALLETIPLVPGNSFACREFKLARFTTPLHFHPEIELTLIVSGRGLRYVGDSIAQFEDGDLVLLGSNLAHYWWNETTDRPHAHSIVVQFPADFIGGRTPAWPEANSLLQLLARSARGIQFTGEARSQIAARMLLLPRLPPWRRLISLLSILGEAADSHETRLLASAGYVPMPDADGGRRMAAACRYIHEQFTEVIRQEEAARRASLSPAAFSRYFRRHMGRTFESYVNEVRIGHVCRLLLESKVTIAEAAYSVGYNNLANFNRRFRAITGNSPSRFRAAHTH
jgi:AraC-like DNA-binding protein/quercetin dioxygenase-like cupin family protein